MRFLAGVLVALIALELAMRPFSNGKSPPDPRVAADFYGAPVVTTRQMEEGIGVANYTVTGARLTGFDPIQGAPIVVVLGDSHVAAREIKDEQTLGAWIERLSRRDGQPINIRQYGWRGANAAQYVVAAADVLARWQPQQTIVVLSSDDLDYHALTVGAPRFRVGDDGRARIVTAPPVNAAPAPVKTWSSRLVDAAMNRSTLVALFRRRRDQMLSHAPREFRKWRAARADSTASPITGETPISDAELASLPGAVVDELQRAFGDRLFIAYAANVYVNGRTGPDTLEIALMARCRQRGVACLSLRDAMVASLNRGAAVRGFSTTNLGGGHLNAKGHEVVGRALWDAIRHRDLEQGR